MSATTPAPPRRSRRPGYVVAILVNAVLLVLVNVWPGWEAVPFLTEATASVVTLVNVSLWVGIAINVIYLVADPRWLRQLGTVVSTAISLAVLVRLVRVFPFDFGDATFDWDFWVRLWLWFLVIAVAIGLAAQAFGLLRTVTTGRSDEQAPRA